MNEEAIKQITSAMYEFRCTLSKIDEYITKLDNEKNNLTLRDQFATSALTGLLAMDAGDANRRSSIRVAQSTKLKIKTFYAKSAYEIADAMLKAREEKE